MSTEPITPEARAAVERLLDDGPAEDSAIRILLDGLEVESLAELKRLVDLGRYHEDAYAAGFGLVAQIAGAVLGRCPHGVDLDRDFCPRGCRV